MNRASELERRLFELRADFDRSFASEPAGPATALEELLAIRVGGDVYAVRLREITALTADQPIVSMPSSVPAFVGLAAQRGELVAVYDLAQLLGYAQPDSPRLLLSLRGTTTAFACAELIGQLRAPLLGAREARPEAGDQRLKDVVQIADATRPIIELQVLLREIEHRVTPRASENED